MKNNTMKNRSFCRYISLKIIRIYKITQNFHRKLIPWISRFDHFGSSSVDFTAECYSLKQRGRCRRAVYRESGCATREEKNNGRKLKCRALELDCFPFAFIRKANELARSFPSLRFFSALVCIQLSVAAAAAAGGAAQRSPTRRETLENQPEKISRCAWYQRGAERGRGGTPCDFPAETMQPGWKRESLADSAAIKDNVFVREERQRRKFDGGNDCALRTTWRRQFRCNRQPRNLSLSLSLSFFLLSSPPEFLFCQTINDNELRSQVLSLIN